jgi:hypothetical protein
MISGGYCSTKLFELGAQRKVLDVLKGSPRDLVTLMSDNGNTGSTCSMTVSLREYKRFDALINLVPANNFVTQDEEIPGLTTAKFPLPDVRNPKEEKITAKSFVEIFVHNVELNSSPKMETELQNTMAALYSLMKMDKKGQKMSPRKLNVEILERKIKVTVHNTWKNITTHSTFALNPPDKFGVYRSDSMLSLKNYIPDDYTAIVFEVEFVVELQGYIKKNVSLGY